MGIRMRLFPLKTMGFKNTYLLLNDTLDKQTMAQWNALSTFLSTDTSEGRTSGCVFL